MAIDARIRELKARHSELDARIRNEVRSPATDSTRIAELKRKKLKLKETIEGLEQPAPGG
jgi:hypothetical protein